MFRNFFFENRAVYEIMWKNTVEPGWSQMTTRRMRHCMLDAVFPLQQWLQERTSTLRYTYSACLVPRMTIVAMSIRSRPTP